MPWAPDYASIAELKAALAPGITDSIDDAALELALSAASRAIDRSCGRQFGRIDPGDPPVVRYYTPTSAGASAVVIDDLMDPTGLEVRVDSGSGFGDPLVLDTAMRLYPWNAAADGRPWTMLVGVAPTSFPRRERAVSVAARWGWAAVPAVVKQACLLQAARLFKRKDAPFGVAGSAELGSELRLLDRLDPDVAVLLAGLRRLRWVAA